MEAERAKNATVLQSVVSVYHVVCAANTMLAGSRTVTIPCAVPFTTINGTLRMEMRYGSY